uniref:Uncharacterized protein n=1 Tax=Oryzias latipes TaxID=8090 RepID=A0A3B3HM07_ORYLA
MGAGLRVFAQHDCFGVFHNPLWKLRVPNGKVNPEGESTFGPGENLPCDSDHGRKREVIAEERFNTWIKLLVQHVCKHFLIQNSERAHESAEQSLDTPKVIFMTMKIVDSH